MPISTIDSKGLTSPLTSGVTTNTVTSAASTALTLQSAGTTAVTIDTSQRVGIGTASPTQALTVAGQMLSIASSGASFKNITPTTGNNYMWLGNTGNNIYVGKESSSGGSLFVGSSAYAGVIGNDGAYPLQFATNNNVQATINSSGQLVMATSTYGLVGQIQAGITADTSGMNSLVSVAGDQNGGYPFGARGNSTNQGLFGFFNSSNSTIGSITKSGSNVAYNTSSDYRLKENIAPMTGALAKVAQLKPVTYTWKEDGSDGEGFIAHELAEVCPHAVSGEKDAVDDNGGIKPQGIDVSFLVATLTSAIQELKALVDAQTAEIAELKAKVAP